MRLPHSWQLGASVLFSNASLEFDNAGAAKPIERVSADGASAGFATLAIAWKAAAIGAAAASETGWRTGAAALVLAFVLVAGPGSSREMMPTFSFMSAV